MNIESRISQLEDKVGIRDQIPPLVIINVADQSKGSTDLGSAQISIVPGKLAGPCGVTQ